AAAAGHDLQPGLAKSGRFLRDGHLALSACVAGEGVALLAREAVILQLRAKTLVSLSKISILQDQSFLLLTPRSRPLSGSALVFIRWMQSLPGTLKSGVPTA